MADNTPVEITETCACGSEISVKGGRYESDWVKMRIDTWREKHVCPKRLPA